MTDNILSAVLTFSLLAGGTAVIGSEAFNTRSAAPTPVVTMPQVMVVAKRVAPLEVVTMPKVMVVAKRATPVEVVTLPTVMVTGRRDTATRVAVETQASEPRRIQ
ncbi:MAG: hypothetical protein ABI699_07040 [Caldimonas sp.]